MSKIDKMASVDAQRWAAAEMFYGEGAGTRRRHLSAELQSKFEDERYQSAFDRAYNALDMNHFAKAAIKERKSLDRAAKASRNFKALRTGNLQSVSNSLYIAGAGYVFFYHTATGVEVRRKAVAKAKELNSKAKTEIRFRRARRRGLNVEKLNLG